VFKLLRVKRDLHTELAPYGNDGWDVISDYGLSLEAILKPVMEYVDRLSSLPSSLNFNSDFARFMRSN
jgi:hypothetical protein